MKDSVLIVVAHPDDEVLGCGGTIAKMAKDGRNIHVAFLSDGVSSREVKDIELNRRRVAAKAACDLLGVTSMSFGEMPDNRMDTLALLDIVKETEKLISDTKPSMIITHHFGDLNIDHRLTYEAVLTACRPQAGHSVKTLLSFEVPSSTEWQMAGSALEFHPNWFEDISAFMTIKLEAVKAYKDELRDWPHPRSIKGVEYLARWRGATVGVDAAEAFMLCRKVI